MAASRTLQIIITAKDLASKPLRGIGKALKGLRGGVTSLQNMMFGLKGAVASLAATVGATVLARSFLDAAVTAERYRMQLKILTGSAKQANELFEEGADFAANVAFEYEHIMGTIVAMRGVIKGGNGEVMKWTRLIADVAAATGMDIQTTTQQVTRMYSAGAQAAELFKERGKLAMLGFQAGVSYTAEETRQRLLRMWEDPSSKIAGAAEQMANTWEGMMSMLGDSWFQFRQTVMEKGGIFDYIKAWVKTYLNFIGRLKKEGRFDDWARQMGQGVIKVLELIAKGAAWVADAFRGWVMIWQGIKMAAAALGMAVSHAFQLMLTAVQQLLSAYQWLLDIQAQIGDAIEAMGVKLMVAAENIPIVNKEIQNIAKGIMGFGSAFATSTRESAANLEGWKVKLEEGKDELQIVNQWLEKIMLESNEILLTTAAEVPYYEKIKKLLIEVNALAKKYRESRESTEGPEVEGPAEFKAPAKTQTIAATELQKFKAQVAIEQANLDELYKKGIIQLDRYYEEKRRLTNESFDKEIELQRRLLSDPQASKDPNKRLQIETKINVLMKQRELALQKIRLSEEDDAKTRVRNAEQVGRIISEITARASTTGEFGLASQFAQETRDMENRQRDEIERLKALKAESAEIEEAYRQQQIEKDKLAADQRWRLQREYMNKAKEALGYMIDAFNSLYESGGKKIKEFFYLQKAAAIAQTLISTYQAAQDAYKSMAGIPIVGPKLAVAAAAAAVIAGLARVEAIRRQDMGSTTSLAEGGKVPGQSPTPKSDNVRINATAGEYVHPVSAVKYYGESAMNAIRTMSIPREVIQGWTSNLRMKAAAIRVPQFAHGYAAGGPVQGGQGGTSMSATTNVTLPEELDFLTGRLQTEVEDTVIRVLQQELR